MAVNLKSKTARRRLTVRSKPYFQTIGGGIQLGYRAGIGKWLVRWWVDGREIQRALGVYADDTSPADGSRILNFKQAEKAAQERASRKENLTLERMTVAACFKRYAKSRDAEGKDTTDSWIRYRKWIKPDFAHKPVAKLTKAELVAWRDEVARHVKPATVNRTLTIFKACLRFGIEELEIPMQGSPIWKALKPLAVDQRSRDRFLTPPELTRLANAAEKDLRSLVLAAAFTGARFGDLARMEVRDWNPDLEKIRIQNQKTNRPRFVRVHSQAVKFFNALTAGRKPGELMLTRSDGSPWRKNSYRRGLLEANRIASIDPPANFHAIRHSYASAMKRAGVDDTIIAAALGHASTRMVQEHYGHLEQSHVDDQIARHAPQLDVEFEDPVVVPIAGRATG
jgi:integrase